MKAKITFLKKTILANLRHKWTVKNLAHSVDVSPAHLQKLFKEEMGISPIQFIKQLRLEKARKLLETTFLRVQQIGFEVGITDQSYLDREFKKKYGATPNQYREQFREKLEAKRQNPINDSFVQ
ncbi:MAG TPA: helix-turn-helix transcriptional regulator [Pyrinomonadaceae bacterium]|nr:helix-turn-helix transcriptional regulator [Pyrinomonadaceae bacterium]